jgi:two-component system, NarL family, response regulator DevR
MWKESLRDSWERGKSPEHAGFFPLGGEVACWFVPLFATVTLLGPQDGCALGPRTACLGSTVGKNPPVAITVLIVGGLVIMSEALHRALAMVTGVRVIGVGRDLAEAERFLADTRPDVILACGWADNDGGALLVEQILACNPEARVVALVPGADDKRLHDFVTAGAFGLVNLQLDGFDTLVSSLHRAAAGEFLLSADTLRRIIQHQRTEAVRQRQRADVVQRLTERELEILALVGCGLDNRMIAEKLYLSVTTVRSHVQHVLAKLGLHSRLQAAMFANRYELAVGVTQAPEAHVSELYRLAPTGLFT